jgi:hypothetical protein
MFSASDMRASLRTDLQSNAPLLESWIKKKKFNLYCQTGPSSLKDAYRMIGKKSELTLQALSARGEIRVSSSANRLLRAHFFIC